MGLWPGALQVLDPSERSSNTGIVLNITRKIIAHTQESLDMNSLSGLRKVSHSLHLGRIHTGTLTRDQMTQEFELGLSKLALSQFDM
jgi:hypothetical protein